MYIRICIAVSFIRTPKLEINQRRLDKQIVYPCTMICLSKEKDQTDTCNNISEGQKYVAEKRLDTKEYIFYDFTHLEF